MESKQIRSLVTMVVAIIGSAFASYAVLPTVMPVLLQFEYQTAVFLAFVISFGVPFMFALIGFLVSKPIADKFSVKYPVKVTEFGKRDVVAIDANLKVHFPMHDNGTLSIFQDVDLVVLTKEQLNLLVVELEKRSLYIPVSEDK